MDDGIVEIGAGRIWGRITVRSIRIMENRLLLVLVEDLTAEKKQLALKRKLNEELEHRKSSNANSTRGDSPRAKRHIASSSKQRVTSYTKPTMEAFSR